MNKRFEENRQYADKRFEDMNRRFEEARQHSDSRFNQMTALLTTFFVVLGLLITFFGIFN